jgi:diaphanous 1
MPPTLSDLQVATSKRFKVILKVLLRVGNHMNGGTRNGGAYGFKLGVLRKIKQSKSVDNKTNLLTFVVQFVEKNYPDAATFVDEFNDAPAASRCTLALP